MSRQVACDGIMACDALVLLNSGEKGEPECVRTNDDGVVTYAFPADKKPAGVKLKEFDYNLVPWVAQGERGEAVPEATTEGPAAAADVYKQQLSGSAGRMLDGQNVVVTSLGHDVTRKFPLVFGDGKMKGLLRVFLDELFASEHVEMHHVSMQAYSYVPKTGEVIDLITEEGNAAKLVEGDAKRAGSDVVGCVETYIDKTNYVEEHAKVWQRVQAERQNVTDACDERCIELALKAPSKQVGADGGDALDLGFDDAKEDTQDANRLQSFIPDPYHDHLVVVQIKSWTQDQTCLQDRTSTKWGAAQFVVLPDAARPPVVGVLDGEDVQRYEQVQKLLCGVMSVLTAIRLKRRRVPFLAHKFTSTLRTVYRQTGERESEMKMIKNASFRAKAWASGPDSPSSPRYRGKPAEPTRTVVLLHLAKRACPQENFHAFTLAKRFVEMGSGSHTGSLTRHLGMEMSQMEREVASLACQLELAKQVHNFRPMLYGVESKGNKTIREREKAAFEKKATQIERVQGERRERIQTAAQHIADRNITEMESRLAQVHQAVSNKQAHRDRTLEELNRWKNMDSKTLDKEIAELTADLTQVERKVAAGEAEAAQLQQKLKKKHDEVQDFATRLRENERKVLAELEQRAQAHKQEVEARRAKTGQHIAAMRTELEAAGQDVLAAAQELKKLSPSAALICTNLTDSVNGLAPLLPRILPSERPSDEMRQRIAQVHERLSVQWAHEMFFLQRELKENNIPLPVHAAATARGNIDLDAAQPVVRVHVTVVGAEGFSTKADGMKYSVAVQRRFDVQETSRRPLQKGPGAVSWGQTFKLTTRLPPKGETRVDLIPLTLSEFLPDGSFSESLPFDVDLLSLACKPPQDYILVPCPDSSLKLRIHAATYRATRVKARANPLCTAKQLAQRRTVDVEYGPSSDDEC
eukprot:TRINITY_DN12352_c0_g1_i2.p1 TRINITY_DN12352_c0_g1~~TRINITY_DN12352_c0_g1_i2.p1  ORF type:complete len:922 (+),score=316.04 TRINITY_DN12352_c0_g1_i2:71-2836(+)